ncbi:MAG: hypothetical protein ACLFTQ_00535 [Candidatus Aenigmatarchaeota archaeon]
MPLDFLKTVLQALSAILPEEIMGYSLHVQTVLPMVAFIGFIYIAYKSMKIAFRGIMVFTAAALFPVAANYFLGMNIPIHIDTMLSYGASGLLLYIGYVFFGTIVSILKIVTWPLRKLFGGGDEELSEEEVEEMLEEEEED